MQVVTLMLVKARAVCCMFTTLVQLLSPAPVYHHWLQLAPIRPTSPNFWVPVPLCEAHSDCASPCLYDSLRSCECNIDMNILIAEDEETGSGYNQLVVQEN